MVYDPKRHHRRSIRLKGYDYRRSGAYFVTIDVRKWLKLFGTIRDGKMYLNEAGLMIQRIWMEIPDYYQGVLVDEFVVMPDHFHGIVVLKGGSDDFYVSGEMEKKNQEKDERNRKGGSRGGQIQGGQTRGYARTEGHLGESRLLSLPDVVQRFKSLTTKKYVDGVKEKNWSRFDGKLWHRNYYERIIHNQKEWDSIRHYIRSNPMNWNRRGNPP